MRPVAVGRALSPKNNMYYYTIVSENGITNENEESLKLKIRNKVVSYQNIGMIKEEGSSLGCTKLDFSVGHNYPEVGAKGIKYPNQFTLLGYATSNNGKVFVISNKDGALTIVSNLEVAILEEFDLITNASYCKDGKVRLDRGTMEEVSQVIINQISPSSIEILRKSINIALESAKEEKRRKEALTPNFSRLDELEKQLPNKEQRRAEYLKSNNGGIAEKDRSGLTIGGLTIGEILGCIGLGMKSSLGSSTYWNRAGAGSYIIGKLSGK